MPSYFKPECSDLEMLPREMSSAPHNASGSSLASRAPSQPNVSMATNSFKNHTYMYDVVYGQLYSTFLKPLKRAQS